MACEKAKETIHFWGFFIILLLLSISDHFYFWLNIVALMASYFCSPVKNSA